jgi:hypothetical protein
MHLWALPRPETLVATVPPLLNGLEPSSIISPPPHDNACRKYSKQWSMCTANTPGPSSFSRLVTFPPVAAVHQCKSIHDGTEDSYGSLSFQVEQLTRQCASWSLETTKNLASLISSLCGCSNSAEIPFVRPYFSGFSTQKLHVLPHGSVNYFNNQRLYEPANWAFQWLRVTKDMPDQYSSCSNTLVLRVKTSRGIGVTGCLVECLNANKEVELWSILCVGRTSRLRAKWS